MSDLQRDMELVAEEICHESEAWPAWQRIRARLTPDRERVAMAISHAVTANFNDKPWAEVRLIAADAAIAAMGETP